MAVAGSKGGSCKTTTAVQLAVHLAGRGQRVLLIDADPRGSAWSWAARATEAGDWPEGVEFVTHDVEANAAYLVRRIRSRLNRADVVVIDTTDQVALLEPALRLAHLVVVPTSPAPMDLDRLGGVLAAIADERARRVKVALSPLAWRVAMVRVDLRSAVAVRCAPGPVRAAGAAVVGCDRAAAAAVQNAFGSGRALVEYAAFTDRVLLALLEVPS